MLDNAEYLYPGVIVYRDTFTKSMDLVNRLEDALSFSENKHKWKTSETGYSFVDKRYRDCADFKIRYNENGNSFLGGMQVSSDNMTKEDESLISIWKDSYTAQIDPVEDYRKMFGLAPLKYWEAFNFVKYGEDQHFQVHSDHGYSYISTLSSVGYINDNYEGGELWFDKINLKIKPKAGDLYLFPSSYIYSHSAMPVKSGVKYSIVTMLDYHEAPHTPEYREIEKKYTEGYL
jgi:hypothetical protein